MAKKAKRLVSESRTQLIECCRLLHIALFSTGTSTRNHNSVTRRLIPRN